MPLPLLSSSSPWHRHLGSSIPFLSAWLALLCGQGNESRGVLEKTTVTPFVVKTKNFISPCPSGCILAAPQPLCVASRRCFTGIWCGPELPFVVVVVVAGYDAADNRIC